MWSAPAALALAATELHTALADEGAEAVREVRDEVDARLFCRPGEGFRADLAAAATASHARPHFQAPVF